MAKPKTVDDIIEPGDVIVIYWRDSVASVEEIGANDGQSLLPRRTVGFVHGIQEDGGLTVLGDMFGHDGLGRFGDAVGAEPRTVAIGDTVRIDLLRVAESVTLEHRIRVHPTDPGSTKS